MNRTIISIAFILISTVYGSRINGQCQIKGKVTCNGKGIKNVIVTDGISCVQTNEKGEYKIPSIQTSGFVYISTPAEYITDCKDKTIPLFYQRIDNETNSYNFNLHKNPKDDLNHTFIAQADVQMTDNDCLNEYKNILSDCKNLIEKYKHQDVFGFNCGDIVGDVPSLYPGYIDASSVLDIPIYRAIGNHDMNYSGRSHETSTQTFESYFGPTHYSFNKGNAHYIVINNTFYIGRDYFYMGYVDEKTLSWLEQDLSYVNKGAPVFVIMHIPSRLEEEPQPFHYDSHCINSQTVNSSALHKILEPYNTHIISGHMHHNQNVILSANLMEHITAAVCGTWWQFSLCTDGTPQGYGVYEVNGNDVKWYYKSSGFTENYQFRSYPQGRSSKYPQDIIANVWNWDSNWKVEWLENEVLQGEMTQFTGLDLEVETLCTNKERIKYSWTRATETQHLFRATPNNPSAAISIRVTDRFGKIYEEKIESKNSSERYYIKKGKE